MIVHVTGLFSFSGEKGERNIVYKNIRERKKIEEIDNEFNRILNSIKCLLKSKSQSCTFCLVAIRFIRGNQTRKCEIPR